MVDFLEYCEHDPETQAICMYIEGLRDGRYHVIERWGLTDPDETTPDRVALSACAKLILDLAPWPE